MSRRTGVLAGVVAVALVAVVTAVLVTRDDGPAGPPLKADVAIVEGVPCCVYDPGTRTVDTALLVDGVTADGDEVTVRMTVTAYADENTEFPVGSATTSVQVTGEVHLPVHLVVPVSEKPRIDDDGQAIIHLTVAYEHSER